MLRGPSSCLRGVYLRFTLQLMDQAWAHVRMCRPFSALFSSPRRFSISDCSSIFIEFFSTSEGSSVETILQNSTWYVYSLVQGARKEKETSRKTFPALRALDHARPHNTCLCYRSSYGSRPKPVPWAPIHCQDGSRLGVWPSFRRR